MSLLSSLLLRPDESSDLVSNGASESRSLLHAGGDFHPALISRCANPSCGSGWMHLFRSRTTPVFEGGWTCSPECTEARIRSMLKRELQAGGSACEQHRHRIPIGLLMLEHGWITQKQLQSAVKSQKQAGTGRIGEWLIRQGATDEATVARALGLQWSCPVLLPKSADGGPSCLVPRVLIQHTAGFPLRLTGHPIYLGFEQTIDPVMGLALQRITGQQVETGIVPSSTFHIAMNRVLRGPFPRAQFVEAANVSAAARQLARAVERHHPVASRLVRVHQYIWLRMWLAEDCASASADNLFDVICTIGAFEFSRSRKSIPVPMNQE